MKNSSFKYRGLCLLALWLTTAAAAQSSDLLFWNKLGSTEELLNTEVGPELIIEGNIGFIEGVHDNGFYSTGYWFLGNRIIIPENGLQLDPEQGTAEAWVMYPEDPITAPYSHAMFGLLDGPYQSGPGRDNTLGQQVTGFVGDGVTGALHTYYVNLNFGNNVQVQVPNVDQFFQPGVFRHLAIVWDRQGIDGTSDKIRLYIDGDVVGSGVDDNWGNEPDVGKRHTIGKGAGFDDGRPAFVIDNIKVWSVARTDFSDRDDEDAGVGPELSIATAIPAAEDETVGAGIDLAASGSSIAATTFSIDYDQGCLFFDDTDFDPLDGIPDDLEVQVPAGFTVTVFHDDGDSDGELDVSIADLAPPIGTLPNGTLVTATFTATCNPEVGTNIDAPVLFSTDPAATFSDDLGQDVDGSASGGSVRIHPGPRGDCNATGEVAAADLIALTLEIFDGDGDFWGDVPGGTFLGSPVGCDANADTEVTAGDVSCTILLVFGGSCGGGAARGWPAMATWRGPELAIDGSPRLEPGSVIEVPVRLAGHGQGISGVAFSLDLDRGLRFDATDSDRDGIPDAVRFPAGTPMLAQVTFDSRDSDGEVDVALATEPGTALADGVLMVLELEVRRPARLGKSLRFSQAPAASFGDLAGRGVPGRASVTWKPRPALNAPAF